MEIYDRTFLRPPCLALTGLSPGRPGEVAAAVPDRGVPLAERSPITTAEAVGHLAALGQCAAATINHSPLRAYYLTRRATGGWLITRPRELRSRELGPLRARARAWFVSRREAAARTLLTDAAGTVLFRLDLGYDVLSSGAMGRLVGTSPGSRDFEPVALDGVRDTGDRVTAEFTVTSGTCAGHYDDAPVLPICALTAAMGQLLPYARGEPGRRWTPGSVSIEAWTPVRAGSTVTVTAPRTGGDRIPCEASVDGAVVARGDLEVGAARAYGSAMS